MKQEHLKLIGYLVLLLLVLNLVVFALRLISGILFWIIIIMGAIFVYKLLPKLKK